MALTFSNLNTATSTTSSASLVATNITAAVNDWILVCIAADNNGTSGVASLSSTLTDSVGNIYNLQSIINRTNASAASDGTTLGIWLARITTVITSGSITATFSPNTTAKAMVINKIVVGTGEWVNIVAVGAGNSGSGTSYPATTVSVTNGYTIIGTTALEQSTAATSDSDTTNGSWSTAYTASANTGSNSSSQSISMQYKTVTATGTQAYTTTSASTRDWAVNTLILSPIRAKQTILVS